ncbi:PTS sorbitol transporter subunit IIA [Enterococcus plantarum]|uniref:PTS sorbitol transporter subunit IIA n=1 Tax=Enterococcus plantarum TaxID=1077675 RepID=A0A2W3YYV2_9ENTE|nr:PTS glucitol/sorbitol transporter subunit IIA [Enterococcus plantarum]MBO0422845.1 PTS glucitol/sorbitol transporter subunit IIA [Enterococcus plantarum]OEG13357.1 PTS sorbitol transporter subunit IIA [Enterococcus plantarum]PZL73048.1 PTS sorbitol transporter subunit IIA [Enterococcus plantarum]
MKAVITEIGSRALDEKEPMIILFGESATEALKEYSVIQKFQEDQSLEVKKGDLLKIDDQEYTIDYVGSFANNNLKSIAHVTLVFADVPKEDAIVNGVYLTPKVFPTLKVGSTIEYISRGV